MKLNRGANRAPVIETGPIKSNKYCDASLLTYVHRPMDMCGTFCDGCLAGIYVFGLLEKIFVSQLTKYEMMNHLM